jgi:hypothetical protein
MLEQLFSRSLSRYTSSPHVADLDAFATMVAAFLVTSEVQALSNIPPQQVSLLK